jgi:hypothetical protein
VSGEGAFVLQLRSAGTPITIGGAKASGGAGTITFRVEASDIWLAVRVIATADARVSELKQRVAESLFPDQNPLQFVLKLGGWEILDDSATLTEAGIGDAAIVLMAYRRRRPVR